MAMVNEMYLNGVTKGDLEYLMLMLSPFAPHIVEEMWELTGFAARYGKMAMQMPWPKFDEAKTVAAERELAVQINGKVRGTVVVPTDADEATVVSIAAADEKIARRLEGMRIVKTIVVKNRIVNFIVKPVS